MESFRNGLMSRSGQLCDVHFSLQGLGDGFRRFQPGVRFQGRSRQSIICIAFVRPADVKFSSGMFCLGRGLSLRLDREFSRRKTGGSDDQTGN